MTPMASSQADKYMDVDTTVEIEDKTPPESAVPVSEIEDEPSASLRSHMVTEGHRGSQNPEV